jgi:hypothetical protein
MAKASRRLAPWTPKVSGGRTIRDVGAVRETKQKNVSEHNQWHMGNIF